MSNLAWFDDNEGELIRFAGGKGASLSRMHKLQLPVPNGFIVTAPVFSRHIQHSGLVGKILESITTIDFDDFNSIETVSESIRNMIVEAPVPDSLVKEISDFYHSLGGESQAVAVRSSSTAEDLDDASFAGQQETFLYVMGKDDVIASVKRCWASLYNGRAIFYRKQKGFDETTVSIAVVVQKMVNSEKSGVMFTVNPISKNAANILIEAAWGLGEGIVSGAVTPDNYIVDKNTYVVLEEYISEKEAMIVRDISNKGVVEMEVPEDKRSERVLSDSELNRLIELAVKLEKVFGKPQDVEWAVEKDKVMLLQSRPITTL